MGREVKRVPANFNWPLRKVWEGYVIPPELCSSPCLACDQTGLNPATKEIADEWYDHEGFVLFQDISDNMTDEEILYLVQQSGGRWTYRYGQDRNGNPATRPPWKIIGTAKTWGHSLTQDEVQALLDEGRLYQLTEYRNENGDRVQREGYVPTAEEVNEWSHRGIGHDSINQWICVKARATRLGVYGPCEFCNHQGYIWSSPEQKQERDAWMPTEPPVGLAYQIWETVSDGSPVSPPFLDPEELAAWMVANDTSITEGTTHEQWVGFILNQGWAPSAIGGPGGFTSGVQALSKSLEEGERANNLLFSQQDS